MIQKVSAAYSAGIAGGSFVGQSASIATAIGSGGSAVGGGRTALHGTSQTALSSKLAPPSKPEYKGVRTMSSWADSLLVVGCMVIGFFAWLIGGQWSFIIATGLIFILFLLWLPSYNRRKKDGQDKYKQAEARYQIANDRWNRLYYCARDDIVFDPNGGTYTSADQMNNLLYP
jgi:hypothetical protein